MVFADFSSAWLPQVFSRFRRWFQVSLGALEEKGHGHNLNIKRRGTTPAGTATSTPLSNFRARATVLYAHCPLRMSKDACGCTRARGHTNGRKTAQLDPRQLFRLSQVKKQVC